MNEQSLLNQPSKVDHGTPVEAPADAMQEELHKHSMAGPVALDLAAGAAAGAIAGTIAGPIGMAIGAVVGGFVGAAAGVAVETADDEKSAHEAQLDRDIGVSGGNIGEASPGQPPSHGRFQAAALGTEGSEPEYSEGPIQNVDAGRS